MSGKLFMDHVSTTPCDPRVVQAMLPYFTEIYGNPSSHVHEQGVLAGQAMDRAREQVAALVKAKDARVVFTSGATEANNLAVLGIALANLASGRKHILLSEIEHYSVYNILHSLRNHGFEVELLPVDASGIVTPKTLAAKLRDDTLLVSVMQANGEIGSLQPIRELAALARAKGAYVHCDATISAGLLPVDFAGWGLSALTLSAHNFYGPKGVGALIVGNDVKIRARSYGGWQEDGLRCGTENVPGIVGMGEAARLALAEMDTRSAHLRTLGAALLDDLKQRVRFIHITGPEDAAKRLPGHASFWVEHVEGESIILFLNARGIMAASGSACSSNLKGHDEEDLVSSHVLAAVGVPTDICAGSVTLSLGHAQTQADVIRVVDELVAIIERLLMMSPTYADYLKQQHKQS
jgi:cysteine desulfurase